LLVKIHAWVPQKLTSEEKKQLEKLQQLPNFQVPEETKERNFFDRVKGMFE
jgi:molecular chaperone DnaJ